MPQEPHRDEHKSAVPWLSPGLVRSNELVLRTILDPDHLEPDGKLALAAISLADIRFRGWSVDRKYFTGLWRVRLSHSEWKKKKPHLRKIHVLPILVGEIRLPGPTTGQQDFVVTDTAVWLNQLMRLFYCQVHRAKVRREVSGIICFKSYLRM